MTTPVTVADFTEENKGTGNGVFDIMMRSVKEHIAGEFTANRIKGPEYAEVYLGALQAAMDRALQLLLARDKLNLELEILAIQRDTALIQKDNAVKEGAVLHAQKCKLEAEFDLIMKQIPKVEAETGLINQRKVSETAQTNGAGVSEDSVLGRQIRLYGNQADGFIRDAEQKVAKLMIDTWNVRRTTDEGTTADNINKLDDTTIGRTVEKLLSGINA